ncbi:MAG: ThiF family adenylyltransferase [Deltaproteobacteria bacterium]|nr:ThiF family adenylyltransferase [Deltaproteobacteria bacterium]
MGYERYSRQILFSEIGENGQRLLSKASVLILGCGALGTVSANHLVRAGVGRVRIVDRDFVELNNLQRQILFDEEDAFLRLPKTVAAVRKLERINSEVKIEPLIIDVNSRNIESVISTFDLILDATDNMETRYLLNDACIKNGVPWIYAGVIGSFGMTMNIIPGRSACLRCLMDTPPVPGSMPTCDTVGVLNSVPGVIASIQATEALKILTGNINTDNSIIHVDLWEREFNQFQVKQHPDCPACVRKEFEFLKEDALSETFSLCGRNAVQITPRRESEFNLENLKVNLSPLGKVNDNGYFLSFEADGFEFVVFPEGRTMIKGTTDESVARTLFAKYIGS